MDVAVTGAAGFLGRHIVARLLAAGFGVRRLLRSIEAPPSMAPNAARNEALIDVVRPGGIESLDAEDLAGCGAVIHLAAAGVSPNRASPEELERTNVEGSRRLARVARDARVPHVVVAGTWAEYGRSLDAHRRTPPDARLLPMSPYPASKAAGFTAMVEALAGADTAFTYLRVFNAFGDGQNPRSLWPSLRAAAAGGQDFEMTSGDQVRDFIAVEVVAEQFLASVVSAPAQGHARVRNVGSGIGISVRAFASQWWDRWGASGALRFGAVPSRGDEPMRAVADIRSSWDFAL